MTTQPTPRTEEALIDNADLHDQGWGKSEMVRADFARQLERENQELQSQIISEVERFHRLEQDLLQRAERAEKHLKQANEDWAADELERLDSALSLSGAPDYIHRDKVREIVELALTNLRHCVSGFHSKGILCPDARMAINKIKDWLARELKVIE